MEMAELLATREAVIFALETGFSDVVLEGDNCSVMNDIRLNEDGLPVGGAVVEDIRALTHSCCFIGFSSIKCEGNNVAHVLAKFTRSLDEFLL